MKFWGDATLRKGALAIGALLLGSVAGSAWAQQPAEAPFHVISRASSTTLTSGAFSVLAADAPRTVRVPEAAWLQLEFSDFNLGRRSTLRIRDLKSGEVQTFTQAQLEAWDGRTAMFSSDRLRISVNVAQNETERVYYQLENILVGESPFGIQSLCAADNRVATTERRVGRLFPVGCTAWIVGNNLFLTAGHCISARTTTLQFNVPASQASGAAVSPAVRDQYAVVQSSIVSRNGGIGNDWALFRVAPNTQTRMLPRQVQGQQYMLSNTRNPTRIRISGFGTDTGATNQTNQTATGPFVSRNGTSLRYRVDTTGGNSGSPVASAATGVAIGIHTNGGCSAQGTGSNSGTSFSNTTLWNAIMNARDPGVIIMN